MSYPVMNVGVPWSLVKSGFHKGPNFNSVVQPTAAKRGSSGLSLQPYATWDFSLDLNLVDGGESVQYSVLQQFLGCFMATCGRAGLFLFTDPSDNTVDDTGLSTPQSLLIACPDGALQAGQTAGDGVTTQFQLARQVDQAIDVLQQVNNVVVMLNGVPVTLAPAANVLTNPNLTDNTGWTFESGWTFARGNVPLGPGPGPANSAMFNGAGSSAVVNSAYIPAAPGAIVSASCWYLGQNGVTGAGVLRITFVGASGVLETIISPVGTANNTWLPTSVSATAPVGSVYAVIDYAVEGATGGAASWFCAQFACNVQPAITATVGNTGLVTFSSPPPNGAALTWSGGFQYLCRFADDELKDLARMSKNSGGYLWSCGSVAFESEFV